VNPTTEALRIIIKLLCAQHETGVSFGTWSDEDIKALAALEGKLPK